MNRMVRPEDIERAKELGVSVYGEEIATTSRHIAKAFGKRHNDVLRDIQRTSDALEKISANLRRSFFRGAKYVDDMGREQPSFVLTRDGLVLLAFGYEGDYAFEIKVQYIQAFNAMETMLRGEWRDGVHPSEALESLSRTVGKIETFCVKIDNGVGRIENGVIKISDDTGEIRRTTRNPYRKVSDETKREHIDAVQAMGGRCPCCMAKEIVKGGERIPLESECDHFYSNQQADVSHTWLICIGCHDDLTAAREQSRTTDDADIKFHAYQSFRRKLSDRQRSFGFFNEPKKQKPKPH